MKYSTYFISILSIVSCSFFSNNLNAASMLPSDVRIIDSSIQGDWDIGDSRGWDGSGEIKITTWMHGNGSVDIQLQTTLDAVGSSAGFSVDLDMFSVWPDTNSWDRFDLTLGTGSGDSFVASSSDALYFDLSGRTEDEHNHFLPPVATGLFPNEISFSDGELPSRADTGSNSVSSLTFFVVSKDSIDSTDNGLATFTMRVVGNPGSTAAVAAVPVPAAWLLFLSGTVFFGFSSKKKSRLKSRDIIKLV